MKRVLSLSAVAMIVVVLEACSITVTPPGPPSNTINVTANLDRLTPVHQNTSLSPGQTQVFRVAPGSASNAQLIYVELNHDIELEVLPQSYQSVIFSANDRSRFSSGRFGLQSTAASVEHDVDSQAIAKSILCGGSCVIQRGSSVTGEFYVRVRNDSGSTVSLNLFVYGDVFGDGSEPDNDSTATALAIGSFNAGAIETVGDVDFWFAQTNGNLSFTTVANGPTLEAWKVDVSGNLAPSNAGPYLHGQTIPVNAGEFIRVWTRDSRFAASTARSRYDIGYLVPAGQ